MAKTFSFLELDKQLSKIEGFEMGSVLETNEFSEVSEWISTGNYLLNAQLSGSLFGGIPNNRSMGIAGDPQTGKSFLCLNITREAQKAGYDVIYCDTEGAIDRSTAKKFGIDTNRVRYQPIKTITDFKVFVANLVDKIKGYRKEGYDPKIMIVLDSLGMLTTDKESGDALKGKSAMDMGIRSKEMRSLFRVITLDLTGVKVPLVCTNHTTTGNIGGFMPTKEAAGGDGPIFSMSNVIMLSKAQLKEGDTKTGIIVTSTPKKARFTRPYAVKFHISFMNGMNPYVGLQDFVSWENCGIQRGKLDIDKKTGEMTFSSVESSPRWAVAHLGKTVASTQLFTPEVFTEEVLRKLDANVIQPHFKLPDLFDEKELEEFVEGDEENNDSPTQNIESGVKVTQEDGQE
jgi:RecA/RadA recombinase